MFRPHSFEFIVKLLQKRSIGKSLSLWELQVIKDLLGVTDIAEKSLNRLLLLLILTSSHHWCSVKKVLFKILQIIQESACVEMTCAWGSVTFLKRDINTGVFSVKFAKFLRTLIKNTKEHFLRTPRSIYVVSMWYTLHFSLHFHCD